MSLPAISVAPDINDPNFLMSLNQIPYFFMSLGVIFYQVDGLLRILSEVDRLRTSCVYTFS